ncbi:MAG: type I-E CRISPR-associated protein Cse2/CasB [Armatimonadota bacterium]
MSVSSSIQFYMREKIRQLDAQTPWARGMLARLRRGAGKRMEEMPDLLEVTLCDLSDEGEITSVDRAVHTALTLYALHRQGKDTSMHESGGNSLGRATGYLISSDRSNEASIKHRFDAVITSRDLAELSYHARGLVQLIRAHDIPVKLDYERFASDLFFYSLQDSRTDVQMRWGRDFYSKYSKNENASAEIGDNQDGE